MIPLNTWLVDLAPGHEGQPTRNRFKVLTIGQDTCEIEEEGGRRAVNRMLIERGLATGELMKEEGA